MGHTSSSISAGRMWRRTSMYTVTTKETASREVSEALKTKSALHMLQYTLRRALENYQDCRSC